MRPTINREHYYNLFYRRNKKAHARLLIFLIMNLFIINLSLWSARMVADIIQVSNILGKTSDTAAGMEFLNNALSAVDMTEALGLINVCYE